MFSSLSCGVQELAACWGAGFCTPQASGLPQARNYGATTQATQSQVSQERRLPSHVLVRSTPIAAQNPGRQQHNACAGRWPAFCICCGCAVPSARVDPSDWHPGAAQCRAAVGCTVVLLHCLSVPRCPAAHIAWLTISVAIAVRMSVRVRQSGLCGAEPEGRLAPHCTPCLGFCTWLRPGLPSHLLPRTDALGWGTERLSSAQGSTQGSPRGGVVIC